MDEHSERRRYYSNDPETALSEAILEALEAHEHASVSEDEFALYDHVNPDAIDMLFEDTNEITISVQIRLENVTVSMWGDGGIDVRVTDKIE